MSYLLTFVHILLFSVFQAFGASMFTLTLRRLGKIQRLYRLKAFLFLFLMNIAGTITYGETNWQHAAIPISAFLITAGVLFFLLGHIYLALHKIKK